MVTYRSAVPNDDDLTFKALADPTRRRLLDLLFARDGRTLTELEAEVEDMTRFGVMKHLRVLEEADLVITRRSGRKSCTISTRCRASRSTTGGSTRTPS